MSSVHPLKEWIRRDGVDMVGFADLSTLPAEDRGGWPVGIAMAVAMDRQIISQSLQGPAPALRAEYTRASERMKAVFARVAERLSADGFRAVRADEIPANYDRARLVSRLSFKMVATLAGLGWIGKSGLLVTKPFGSAVRLFAVVTDAPLAADAPVTASLCGQCVACRDGCLAGAIRGELWQPGRARDELIDAAACRAKGQELAAKLGLANPTCGRCVAVCPWTQRYIDGRGESLYEKLT